MFIHSIHRSVPTVQPLVQVTQFITCGIRLPWASISSPVFAAGSKCLYKVTFLEENKVVYRAWRTQISTPHKSWWMWRKSLMFQLLSSFFYHFSIIEVPWRTEARTSNHLFEAVLLHGSNALQCWMLEDAGSWFTSTSGIEDLCASTCNPQTAKEEYHGAAGLMQIQLGTKDQAGPCIYIHHWLVDLCNRFYHENPWDVSIHVLLQNLARVGWCFRSSVQGDQFLAKWRILTKRKCIPLWRTGVWILCMCLDC